MITDFQVVKRNNKSEVEECEADFSCGAGFRSAIPTHWEIYLDIRSAGMNRGKASSWLNVEEARQLVKRLREAIKKAEQENK